MRRLIVIFVFLIIAVAIAGGGYLLLALDESVTPDAAAPSALVDASAPEAELEIVRPPAPEDAPNVVLLIIDTLRADRLGMYGGEAHEQLPAGVSPELDALAAGGVRFARAISQSSWTRPSIGSLLTSRHPRTLGIYVEREEGLDDEFETVAEVLRASGYRTLGFTANPNINTVYNFNQGFDDYADSGVVWSWMREPGRRRPTRPLQLPGAQDMFRDALDRVDAMPEGPVYLQFDLMEVHEHLRPSEMLRAEYEDLFEDREDANYLRSIRQVSADIGAFLETLLALPRFENTLVIVTSDHGEGLDSHPHVRRSQGHGRLVYDSQNWVPLFMHHTGGRLLEGHVVSRQVRLLDLMPTLLDFIAIEGPEEMDGVSLMPLLADEEADVDLPPFFVVETHFRGASAAGLYGANVKFVHHQRRIRGTNRTEIQRNFVYEDGSHTDLGREKPAIRNAMSRYLERWMEETPRADPFRPTSGVSREEIEQLRAIGYVQ